MVEVVVTYEATVERGDRYWVVSVSGVERSTQARHLRELDDMVKDLIHVMTKEPVESIQVNYHIVLPSNVQARLEHAEQLRKEAAEAQAQAAAETRAAARELHGDGIPLRDIGRVLGVTYQRAHQLVGGAG